MFPERMFPVILAVAVGAAPPSAEAPGTPGEEEGPATGEAALEPPDGSPRRGA